MDKVLKKGVPGKTADAQWIPLPLRLEAPSPLPPFPIDSGEGIQERLGSVGVVGLVVVVGVGVRVGDVGVGVLAGARCSISTAHGL